MIGEPGQTLKVGDVSWIQLLRWQEGKPIEPGWYWAQFRERWGYNNLVTEIIKVSDDGYTQIETNAKDDITSKYFERAGDKVLYPVETIERFSGPIPEPTPMIEQPSYAECFLIRCASVEHPHRLMYRSEEVRVWLCESTKHVWTSPDRHRPFSISVGFDSPLKFEWL